MDEETRKLLEEVVEALEAVLLAAQLEERDRRGADYALREAIRRVNRLRRAVQGGE